MKPKTNPKITPFLWFDDQAEEAVKFYRSIFKNSRIVSVMRNGKQVMGVTFRINGQELIAFNGGPHFKFNCAISLFVHCRTQREVDYYWIKLTNGGAESRCGWLTDRFGLSWQIVPDILSEVLGDKDPVKAGRAMQAMLQMRKLDIQTLKRAHAGR